MTTSNSMTKINNFKVQDTKRVRKQRPYRPRTNLLRGNFQLFNEVGNLKLFSEPNDGRKGVVFENNKKVMDAFPRVKSIVVFDNEIVGDLTDDIVAKNTLDFS